MASIISAGTSAGTAIAISGDTTGNLAFTTQAGANTITVPNGTGTLSVQGVSTNIVSGTSVASTSGTSIDFTNIPSWVKRITVMFQGVSSNGSSPPVMRLGTSGGFVSSGYASGGVYTGVGTGSGNRTDSLLLCGNAFDSSATLQGHAVLTNITGNSWVQSFTIGQSNTAYCVFGGGSITLAGALTQIRITTANGTDAFDAGSINILYE